MSENKPLIITLVAVGLTLMGLLIYFLMRTPSEPEVIPESLKITIDTPTAVEPEFIPEPKVEKVIVALKTVEVEPTPPAFVLPRLDDSDQLLRDGVVSLTRHEGINAWLSPDELVRKVVVLVDNIANGSIAKQSVAVLTPLSAFSATAVSDQQYIMDEKSYTRYNLVTNILTSLDAKRSAELYVLLKPLFQEAYDELGYPDAKFDDAIFKAIGRMLETPIINEPISLVRPVVMYEYEDKNLERLSSAQKQMLRMGPKNTRAIQTKLGELALALRAVIE